MTNRYAEVRSRSVDDPEGFWAEAAEEIHWYKKWHKVLDDSNKPLYRWFVGGEVNTCYNAVDRHIANGRGEQVALIYDSPVTDTIQTFTFYALREEIAKCAGALADVAEAKKASPAGSRVSSCLTIRAGHLSEGSLPLQSSIASNLLH